MKNPLRFLALLSTLAFASFAFAGDKQSGAKDGCKDGSCGKESAACCKDAKADKDSACCKEAKADKKEGKKPGAH